MSETQKDPATLERAAGRMERMMTLTYQEKFTPGTKVVVRAGPGEGTDHDYNGRTGTVEKYSHWVGVCLDRPLRDGRKSVMICPHNLTVLPSVDLPTPSSTSSPRRSETR